jgi:O-Antigen ligase
VVLLLWWAILAGLAVRLLPRARVPTAALVAGGCLAGLAVLTAASAGWASDDGAAFDEAVRAAGYVGIFALVVLASPAHSGRDWLQGLALGLLAVALLGLASRFEPSLFPESELPVALPETRGRLSYPIGYWNAMGALMGLAVVLLLWVAANARTAIGRAGATAAVPLPALGLTMTSSRGGVVALAVGLVLLFVIGAPRVRLVASALLAGAGSAGLIAIAVSRNLFMDGLTDVSGYGTEAAEVLLALLAAVGAVFALRALADGVVERIRVPRAVSVALLVCVALAVVGGVVASDPAERFRELRRPPEVGGEIDTQGLVTRHLTSTEGTGRWQFWDAGWDALQAEPVVGIGAGGYEAWWAQHGSIERFVRNAHSLFVETGAELGTLGVFLLLGFLLAPVAGVLGWRFKLPAESAVAGGAFAALGCGVAAAALEWTWEIPAAFAPAVVAAAVLAGPALGPGPIRGRIRYLWGGALVVAACAAVFAGGVALVGDSNLRASRTAAREGDYQTAAEEARHAQAVQPWAAEPRLQLALVEELRGSRAALRAVDEAIERAPEDWRVWIVATRLRTKAGDIPGAILALRRVNALTRSLPVLRPIVERERALRRRSSR